MAVPQYDGVVGAGFSGIGAGIALDRAGLGDYTIIEAGDGPGGTWYWNTYPGIAVDIPSFSYQFSFEKSPNWSRTYAPGSELRAYAEHCVDKYGLRSRIRFTTKVLSATFDDADSLYLVELDSGEIVTARFLINACGALITPKMPEIDGVDSFAGVTMHTARWDHTQDLTGKRVAVIGTGASAVQVIPEIAPIVQRLTVFQRTPIWCFPKFDVPLPPIARRLMRLPGGHAVQRLLSQAYVELTFTLPAQYFTYNPLAKHMAKFGEAYLRKQVRDPQVRAKLTPDYAVGCKRPGFHNSYLATYNRDNVELVTEPIDKITGSGVAFQGGGRHLCCVAGQCPGQHVDGGVGVGRLGGQDAVRIVLGGGEIDVIFFHAPGQGGVDLLAAEPVGADGVAAVAGGGALCAVDGGGVAESDVGSHILAGEVAMGTGFQVRHGQ